MPGLYAQPSEYYADLAMRAAVVDWMVAVISLVAVMISAGALIFAIMARKHSLRREEMQAVRAEIKRNGDDLHDLQRRSDRLETTLMARPDSDAVHELAQAIERLSGRLETSMAHLNAVQSDTAQLRTELLTQRDYLDKTTSLLVQQAAARGGTA